MTASIHVGTSGWAYDEWAGVFYPEHLKARERLAYYLTQFDTLEINATFYCTPSQVMIDAWNRQLPADYPLLLKGPRLVTHLKKLADCAEPLAVFFDRAGQLRTLRVVLWQLPPSLHKDVGRLERFLAELPKGVRHAVEFRHASWWDDEVAAALARRQAAMVAVSHPRLPDDVYPTTDFLYVRFHGLGKELYRYDYSRKELSEWVRRLESHLRGRVLYALFNNTADGHAPHNAALLKSLLTELA